MLSGLISVPLLLAKLWTVYPNLFAKLPSPPSRKALGTVLERLSIAVLVATMALELFIGFLNTLQWYPWPFPFKQTHYALAWIIVGALLVHLAVKLLLIIANWRRTAADRTPVPVPTGSLPPAITGIGRRGLFRTVAGAGAGGSAPAAAAGQGRQPDGAAARLPAGLVVARGHNRDRRCGGAGGPLAPEAQALMFRSSRAASGAIGGRWASVASVAARSTNSALCLTG